MPHLLRWRGEVKFFVLANSVKIDIDITRGARRKLQLVDSDDDDRIQGAYVEEDGFKDDDNERDNSENEDDDLSYPDDAVDEDMLNEDIELAEQQIEDDLEEHDSEDALEDEGDERAEQQIEGFSSQKTAVVMKRCLRAKEIRMSQKNMHTAGPKSFARIREEMMNDDPNKEPPTLAQMFERTRRRTIGNKYIDTYDDTAKKIEQMKNYKPLEDGSGPIDPFEATMGKEYDGHRRLYGRGVTNRLIKKVSGDGTSYMVPDQLMDSIRENVEVEKNQLLDMRRELEEDHLRKKAELEGMRKDIDKMVEDAVQKII
ncbi:hypothetical protein L2E82_08202 [Cichorium intybus]|uniref:Uncharacterized protein n=1 Tax=Cichorium intybus TaxID=13427 RepID=A0ACB9G5W7_CICIN|nr:hypothetical protein L2E82_08202 [Cichorium intybus]